MPVTPVLSSAEITQWLSLIGTALALITAVGSVLLQFRKDRRENRGQVVAEVVTERRLAGDQAAQFTGIALSLLAPMKQQITELMGRVSAMETQATQYRRWITKLLGVVRALLIQLEAAEVPADPVTLRAFLDVETEIKQEEGDLANESTDRTNT